MATSREIKKRIKSVQNTKKITRTMELVSTAKAKKAVDRVNGAAPFAAKIRELIETIGSAGIETVSPLLRQAAGKPRKAIILVIAANRGLCGGFNNNVAKLALNRIKALKEAGTEVALMVAGKKVVSMFKFAKVPMAKTYTAIDDKVTFNDILPIADHFMTEFGDSHTDLIEIIYTKYLSAGKQEAVREQMLPLSMDGVKKSGSGAMIFEPSAEEILRSLLPRAIRVGTFQSFLDSAASEQIARRVAMKNATSAASDMIKSLTLSYNRARQAKITQEIAEIVGGSAASAK